MHPDYAKTLNRIFDLVESGQLPETAVSRLFHMGHKVLFCFGHGPEREEWKCERIQYHRGGCTGNTISEPAILVTT